jgi:hypothetical protein
MVETVQLGRNATDRHAWQREPFTSESREHVSVWEKLVS